MERQGMGGGAMKSQQFIGPFSDDVNIPPPPDGSGIVPVGGTPVSDIPPPPDGSGVAPDVAPTQAPIEGQFGDDPNAVASRMAPKDEAHVTQLLRSGDYDGAAAFAHSKGFTLGNADAIRRGQERGIPVPDGAVYERAKAPDNGAFGAFADSVGQGATLGFSDELVGLAGGAVSAAQGNGFGNGYNRAIDQARAQLGSDEENHGISSLLGNLAGGIILPVGLEKAGITESTRAVGLAARDAAIASGVAPSAADRIAARAIAHRLAAEGAVYGGGYGIGSSEGSPGERLLAGAEGAAGGALLGGVVAPLAGKGLNAAARGARSVYGAATRSFTDAGARSQASDILAGQTIRPIEDVLNNIANRGPSVPGSQPTLAEVAGDTGLAGFQRGLGNSTPEAGAALGERNAQNAIARTAYADEALGAGNPQAVQDEAAAQVASAQDATAKQQAERAATAERRLSDLRTNATSDRQAAEQAVVAGRAAIGEAVDRTATGATKREQFGDAYDAAKARTREAYAAPALKAETPVEIGKPVFDDILASAHEFYGNGGGEMPGELQAILSDAADSPTTTRTLTNLDQRLADFAGSQRMAGRNKAAAFAESVRDRLTRLAHDAASPEYREALANAKAVRREQGRVFETGDAAKAFGTDKFGNPVVQDTTLPTRLVRPGAPGGDTADGLIAAIGPEGAEQAFRQELRRVVDETGVTTEAQARSIATRYGEAAKRFPSLRSDLDALTSHAGRLDAARGAEREAERATTSAAEKAHINELSAAETAIKASPVSRIADPAQDPASFICGLLRRSDGGRALSRLASDVKGNDDAVAGMRRAMGQYIVDAGAGVRNTASGDDIPALAKTRKAISTIVTRAGGLLTREQKIALQHVSRELKATNFAMNAGRPSGSDTAQNQSYKALLHFAPLPPGTHAAASVVKVIASAFTNRAQVQNLLTQAVLDPDFAATLLKRPTQAHLDLATRKLLGTKAVATSAIIAAPAEQSATQLITGTQ